MKSIFTLIFLLIILNGFNVAQKDVSQLIFDNYSKYKALDFENKRFRHQELKNKIEKLSDNKNLKIKVEGKSLEGREIYSVSIGKGPIKVLLWSQMHGDESTATMALIDIFNFISASDELNPIRKELFTKLTICFVPMLNPDGAEDFKRRNALDIDLNRDALRLQFPESQILKRLKDTINPKFAFNLHDQSTRYSAGNSFRSATISFLAPAFNYAKDINEVRGNTMKLIVDLHSILSNYIPGHIAKYNDDFEPRAFGDNFIKWGTSSVLVESGGWKNDTEKQFIRKLNYLTILCGLYSIATKNYENSTIAEYEKIPFNDKLLFDLLLRNLKIIKDNKEYIIDVGINKEELYSNNIDEPYFEGKVEDWGDLSIFYGHEELNLTGFEIRESKILEHSDSTIDNLDIVSLISDGYGFIKVNNSTINSKYSPIQLNIICDDRIIDLAPGYQKNANFTIWKNNKLKYNVVNGFIHHVETETKNQSNGLVFK